MDTATGDHNRHLCVMDVFAIILRDFGYKFVFLNTEVGSYKSLAAKQTGFETHRCEIVSSVDLILSPWMGSTPQVSLHKSFPKP